MIYTVTTTLPLSHGGRTQALLRRIKLLDEEFKIPSKILSKIKSIKNIRIKALESIGNHY